MATYNKKRFFWLQLKEDFFEDDAIEWLEEQKNGKDYVLFYLKLCLKSLKTDGILIRNVGNLLIPYDAKKLSELTKTDYDIVIVSMKLLTEIGLIKILDNGEIYLDKLNNMIGSKSEGAFKKQQQRLSCGQLVDNCPPEQEQEQDQEQDNREKEKEKKCVNICHLNSTEKNESCSECMKKEICTNPESKKFLLKHPEGFNNYINQLNGFYENILNNKSEDLYEVENEEYDWMNDSEDVFIK